MIVERRFKKRPKVELTQEEIAEEVWRDCVGYEGRYKISNFGRVCSLLTKSHNIIQLYSFCTETHSHVFYYKLKGEDGRVRMELVENLYGFAFLYNINNE